MPQLIRSLILLPVLAATGLMLTLASCDNSPTGPQEAENGYRDTGKASYYGKNFDGKLTANGDTFRMDSMTCAHPSLPFGTRLKVTNLANQKEVIVEVNDRGPHTDNRIIDLSRGAAKKIDLLEMGTTQVRLAELEKAYEQ